MSNRQKLLEQYKLEDELYSQVFESFSLEKYQDLYTKILNSFKKNEVKELTELKNKYFGNYIFLDIIAESENETVFIAKKHSLAEKNLVYIHFFKIQNITDFTLEKLIEMNLLRKFESPYVINLLDCGVVNDFSCFYEIYSFEEGINFYDLTNSNLKFWNKIPLEIAMAFGIELSLKLRKIHSSFRTPFNILVSGCNLRRNIYFSFSGQMYLHYLTIPYFHPEQMYVQNRLLPQLKDAKHIAPEVFLNQLKPSIKSDQFIMALLIWELIAGESFFDAKRNIEDQLGHYLYRNLHDKNEQIPKELDQILSQALHPNPEKRFEHCEQFSKQLEALYSLKFSNAAKNNLTSFIEKSLNDFKLEWILKSMYYQEVNLDNSHIAVQEIRTLSSISFLMEDNRDKSWQLC